MYETGKAYGLFSGHLFVQDLRRSQKRLIRYGIVLAIIFCFFFLLYPVLASGKLYDLILFGFLPSTMEDFFKLEWLEQVKDFHFYFPFATQFITMLLCIFAAMQGLTALRREEEDGTIEFIYSLPVSRQGVYLSKLCARIVTMVIMNCWCAVVLMILCAFTAPEGAAWPAWTAKLFGYSLLSELVFLSFGFLISTFIHDMTTATSIAFGAFLVTYLCGLAAALFKGVSWLRFFSPYHLANPFGVVEAGFALDSAHLLLLLAFSLLCLLGGCVRYLTKDFFRR